MIKKREGYVAPPRASIVREVSKILADVPVETLENLSFTALYSIHSEIVCYDLDPDAVAELNITGYKCGCDVSAAREAVKQFRRDLKKQLAEAARQKKGEARAKARAARERARAHARK